MSRTQWTLTYMDGLLGQASFTCFNLCGSNLSQDSISVLSSATSNSRVGISSSISNTLDEMRFQMESFTQFTQNCMNEMLQILVTTVELLLSLEGLNNESPFFIDHVLIYNHSCGEKNYKTQNHNKNNKHTTFEFTWFSDPQSCYSKANVSHRRHIIFPFIRDLLETKKSLTKSCFYSNTTKYK